MANNYQPIYSGVPATPTSLLTNAAPAALTTSDGATTIGTNSILVFTAATTYGSFLSKIRFQPYGIVASTTTTATVFRIYLSSVSSGATTATNTKCIQEIAAATQATAHPTIATNYIDVPFNMALSPGVNILITTHATTNSNTGWAITVFAGDYVATP